MKKKIVLAILIGTIAGGSLVGCSKGAENADAASTIAEVVDTVKENIDEATEKVADIADIYNKKKDDSLNDAKSEEVAAPEETTIETEEFTTENEASTTMYITGDIVNVRYNPNTQASIVGTLTKGTAVSVTGESIQGWHKASANGLSGYVSDDFLSEDAPVVAENTTTEKPAVTPSAAQTTTPATTTKSTQTTPVNPSASYASELTGLPISTSIQNQRPIAVMVDNEKTALQHYGVGEADIVYEMMNSTANGRITRLMCVYKDWQNIDRIGSIRSTRSTNPMLAAEYNAVLIHDGGPYYINTYLSQPWARHLSGGFARIKNGKPTEFTEYVTKGEVAARMKKAGYSTTYDNYKNADSTHFNFGKVDLSSCGLNASNVALPFPHNSSQLKYNSSTGTYDYYEYGSIHKDAEDGQVATFTNVILQNMTYSQLDKNGYLIYNCIGEGTGYYLTGGKMIPIIWRKCSETDITRFYNSNGEEITINAGKTYIGLVPSDVWSSLAIN